MNSITSKMMEYIDIKNVRTQVKKLFFTSMAIYGLYNHDIFAIFLFLTLALGDEDNYFVITPDTILAVFSCVSGAALFLHYPEHDIYYPQRDLFIPQYGLLYDLCLLIIAGFHYLCGERHRASLVIASLVHFSQDKPIKLYAYGAAICLVALRRQIHQAAIKGWPVFCAMIVSFWSMVVSFSNMVSDFMLYAAAYATEYFLSIPLVVAVGRVISWVLSVAAFIGLGTVMSFLLPRSTSPSAPAPAPSPSAEQTGLSFSTVFATVVEPLEMEQDAAVEVKSSMVDVGTQTDEIQEAKTAAAKIHDDEPVSAELEAWRDHWAYLMGASEIDDELTPGYVPDPRYARPSTFVRRPHPFLKNRSLAVAVKIPVPASPLQNPTATTTQSPIPSVQAPIESTLSLPNHSGTFRVPDFDDDSSSDGSAPSSPDVKAVGGGVVVPEGSALSPIPESPLPTSAFHATVEEALESPVHDVPVSTSALNPPESPVVAPVSVSTPAPIVVSVGPDAVASPSAHELEVPVIAPEEMAPALLTPEEEPSRAALLEEAASLPAHNTYIPEPVRPADPPVTMVPQQAQETHVVDASLGPAQVPLFNFAQLTSYVYGTDSAPVSYPPPPPPPTSSVSFASFMADPKAVSVFELPPIPSSQRPLPQMPMRDMSFSTKNNNNSQQQEPQQVVDQPEDEMTEAPPVLSQETGADLIDAEPMVDADAVVESSVGNAWEEDDEFSDIEDLLREIEEGFNVPEIQHAEHIQELDRILFGSPAPAERDVERATSDIVHGLGGLSLGETDLKDCDPSTTGEGVDVNQEVRDTVPADSFDWDMQGLHTAEFGDLPLIEDRPALPAFFWDAEINTQPTDAAGSSAFVERGDDAAMEGDGSATAADVRNEDNGAEAEMGMDDVDREEKQNDEQTQATSSSAWIAPTGADPARDSVMLGTEHDSPLDRAEHRGLPGMESPGLPATPQAASPFHFGAHTTSPPRGALWTSSPLSPSRSRSPAPSPSTPRSRSRSPSRDQAASVGSPASLSTIHDDDVPVTSPVAWSLTTVQTPAGQADTIFAPTSFASINTAAPSVGTRRILRPSLRRPPVSRPLPPLPPFTPSLPPPPAPDNAAPASGGDVAPQPTQPPTGSATSSTSGISSRRILVPKTRTVSRVSRQTPSTPRPAQPPIAFDLTDSADAPKLDRRFVVENGAPTRPVCNIIALQTGYRPPASVAHYQRRVRASPADTYVDSDDYPHLARWDIRGSPPLDEEALRRLFQKMAAGAEAAREGWLNCRSRRFVEMGWDGVEKEEEEEASSQSGGGLVVDAALEAELEAEFMALLDADGDIRPAELEAPPPPPPDLEAERKRLADEQAKKDNDASYKAVLRARQAKPSPFWPKKKR